MRVLVLLSIAALALLLAACSGEGDGDGGGGRELPITVSAQGCAPERITAQPGEKLTFVVKNESSTDRELEGIEGTRLEEVLVPAGRTRNINYTMPAGGATQKLKCYLPGGPSTIIELAPAK